MLEFKVVHLALLVAVTVGASASEMKLGSDQHPSSSTSDIAILSRTTEGPSLSLADLNTGLNPKRGHFVYSVDHSDRCVVENVRDLTTLPASLTPVRDTLRDFSFGGDGSFAEAACWVFVYPNDEMQFECARMRSATSGSTEEINVPLRRLIGKSRSANLARYVLMIHSHPTEFETRHFGPSAPDLALHFEMETKFGAINGLPMGSYISLVFPLDRHGKTDFFYSVQSFLNGGRKCPKNAGE